MNKILAKAALACVYAVGLPLIGGLMMLTVAGCKLEDELDKPDLTPEERKMLKEVDRMRKETGVG